MADDLPAIPELATPTTDSSPVPVRDDDRGVPTIPSMQGPAMGLTMAPKDNTHDTLNLLAGSTKAFMGSLAREAAVRSQAAGATNLSTWLSDQSRLWHMDADDSLSKVSDETTAQVNAPITSGEFWKHPVSALTSKAIAGAPQFAATIAGSWNLPVEAVTGAIIASSAAADMFMDSVDKADDKSLQQSQPAYKALRDQGVPELEAKDKFGNEAIAANHTDLWAGAAGGATGAFFPAGQFRGAGNLVFGPTKSFAGRALRSGVEAGAAGAGADLGINLALNQAAGNTGIGEQKSAADMASSAFSQFAGQGVFGAGFGAMHRGKISEEIEKTIKKSPQDVAQVGGQSAVAAVPVPGQEAPGGETVSGEVAPGIEGTLSVNKEPEAAAAEGPTKDGVVNEQRQPTGGEAKPIRSPRNYKKAKTPEAPDVPADASADAKARAGAPTATAPQPNDEQLAALNANKEPAPPAKTPTIDSSKPTGVINAPKETPGKTGVYRNGGGQDQGPISQRPNLELEKDKTNTPTQPTGAEGSPERIAQPEVVQIQPVINREGQGQANTTGELRTPQPVAEPQPSPIVADSSGVQTGEARPLGEAAPTPKIPELKPSEIPTTTGGTYADARDLVLADQKASTSYLQRKLGLTYGDAQKAVAQLEREGVISAADKSGRRTVLMKAGDEAAQPKEPVEPKGVQPEVKVQEPTVQTEPVKSPIEEKPQLPVVEGAAAQQAKQEAETKPLGPLIAGRDYGISGKLTKGEQAVKTAKQLEREQAIAQGKAETQAEPAAKGGNRTKGDIQKLRENNRKANEIMNANPMTQQDWKAVDPTTSEGVGARTVMLERLQKMVGDAQAEKVRIPPEFNKMANPAHDHAPAVLLIKEANDFLKRAKTADSDAYTDYLIREGKLRRGQYPEVLEDRKREAEEALARQGKGPRAGEVSLEALTEKGQEKGEAATAEDIAAFKAEKQAAVGKVKKAADETQEPKSAAQAEAGNYKKGHVTVEGLPVSIETAKGQIRRGVDAQGRQWEHKSVTHYGYILRTRGADGDHLDVHLNPKEPNAETGRVFVLNQKDPVTGRFDEHKVMLGYRSVIDAMHDYMKGFGPGEGARRLMGGIEMSRPEFTDFLKHGDLHQPIGEGVAGQHLSGYVQTAKDENGTLNYFRPTSRQTLREALGQIRIDQYHPALQPFMRAIVKRLQDMVGDVNVYTASDKDFAALGHKAAGYYAQAFDHIVMKEGYPIRTASRILLHEAVHAATLHSLEADRGFNANTYKLMHHTMELMKDNLGYTDAQLKKEFYAFKDDDPAEFISEAMSNPDFQIVLSQQHISDEMAKALGMPQGKIASIWKALVDQIRRGLNIPEKATSALEAAMTVTEHSMWARDPREEARFMDDLREANAQPIERQANKAGFTMNRTRYAEEPKKDPGQEKTDEVHALTKNPAGYAKEGEKRVQGTLAKVRQELTDSGVNASGLGMRAMARLLHTTNIFNWAGKDWETGEGNSFRDLIEGTERKGGMFREIREGDSALGDRLAVASKTYQGTEHERNFEQLLEVSSRNKVHADYPLGEGKNGRFQIGKNTNEWDEGQENWQGRKAWAKASALYEKLPKDLQKIYRDMRDFYEGRAKDISDQLVDDTLRSYDPPPGSTHEDVIKRYQTNKHTDADEKYYEELGLTKDIRDSLRLAKDQGPYFPVWRDGRFVVKGSYDLDAGGFDKDMNGTNLNQNVREFDSRKEAWQYQTGKNDGLSAEMKPVNYMKDKDTGGVWKEVSSKEASSDPNAQYKERYRVTVQNERVEMKETRADALRILNEMKDEGIKYVSQILDKRDPAARGKLLGSHVEAVIRRIESRDDLSEASKANAVDALYQTMLASKSNSSLSKHFMKRYNVQGGEFSTPRAYDDYSRASASWLASARTRSTIDSSLKAMGKRADEMQGGANGERMSVIINEMNRRVGLQDRNNMDPEVPRWMKSVMQWNFMRYLAAPAHLLMHMVHVPMFVAPYLGSKYGYGTGYRALGAAYRDLGGMWPAMGQSYMSAGRIVGSKWVKDVQKQLDWGKGVNYLDTITRGLTNPLERKLYDRLQQTNHIHANSGMEMSAGREIGVERTNRALREITSAPDTINRSVTALAAFRLEMAKSGGDFEKSVQAAKEALEFTQGQMSQSNMAPWMNAKWIRPFMQFRQFPMQITYMLGKTVYNILKNEDGATRMEGLKFAAGLLGTAALMTGINGMPTEVLKIPVLLGAALGITKMPSEYNAETQEKLSQWFGPTIANIFMNGLPAMLGPVAPYIPHRAGMSSLWTFGEPTSDKPDDLWNWGMKTVFGATGSSILDGLNGVRNLEDGNYAGAAEKLAPFSWGSHIIKAWQMAEEGKPTGKGEPGMPAQGILPAIPELLGFTSLRRAEYQTGQSAAYAELHREQTDKSATIKTIARAATEGDRFKAINEWNQANPDNPITGSQVRNEIARKGKEEVFGFGYTRHNKVTLDELRHVYGF